VVTAPTPARTAGQLSSGAHTNDSMQDSEQDYGDEDGGEELRDGRPGIPVTTINSPKRPHASSSTMRRRIKGNELPVGSQSAPGGDWQSRLSKFCALADENSDDDETKEKEISTPTREDFIDAASKMGFTLQDLIQAETELNDVTQVSSPSLSRPDSCCPTANRIINAMVNDASQKRAMKPWKGPLPKPRISPQRTLGDALIKTTFI
jgi:hypothetical protein